MTSTPASFTEDVERLFVPANGSPLATFASVVDRCRHNLDTSSSSVVVAGPDEMRVFSCDGGTALAAYIAHSLGMPYTINVGVYWHTDGERIVERRATLGAGPDEHHHWLILHAGADFSHDVLVDLNGPERGEPYVQWAHDNHQYEPGIWEDAVYDRSDAPAVILASHYPATWQQLPAIWDGYCQCEQCL